MSCRDPEKREAYNAARRARYAENPQPERARQRKWKEANPDLVKAHNQRALAARKAKYPQQREAIQAYIRKFRAAHPEKVREYNQRAYKKHRLALIARATKYAKENPQVVAATQAKRRAAKMGASLGDKAIIAQWRTAIRAMKWVRCHWCGTKVPGKKVQFDHVVALANGGAEAIGNYCTACPECNQSKNARVIADWVVGGQSFLSL